MGLLAVSPEIWKSFKMSKKCPAGLSRVRQKKCQKNVPGLPEMSKKCPKHVWGTFFRHFRDLQSPHKGAAPKAPPLVGAFLVSKMS